MILRSWKFKTLISGLFLIGLFSVLLVMPKTARAEDSTASDSTITSETTTVVPPATTTDSTVITPPETSPIPDPTISPDSTIDSPSSTSSETTTPDPTAITSTDTGGSWSSSSTWVGGKVPGTGDTAIIATKGTNTVSLDSDVQVKNLTLTSGTLSSGTNTLSLGGDWTNSGGSFAPDQGTVVFNDASQTSHISGNNTFNNLICLTPGKTIIFEADSLTSVLGTLTVEGDSNNYVNLTSSVSSLDKMFGIDIKAVSDAEGNPYLQYLDVSYSHAYGPVVPIPAHNYHIPAELNVDWDATYTSTSTGGTWATGTTWVGGVAPTSTDDAIIATTGANSVTLGAAAQIVNLTINANATLAGSTFLLTVTGNYTNNGTHSGSGGVTVSGASSVIGGTGNTTNSGTFTISGATAPSFSGTSTLTITGNLTMSGPVTITSGANITESGTTAISGAVTITNNGTFNANGSSGITGSVAGSTWTQGANSTLNFKGSGAVFLATGTLNASNNGNTINYNFTGAQTVKATATYYHLTLSGSGIKTLTATTTTISGNLTLSGTATVTTVVGINIGTLSIGNGTTFTAAGFALTISGTTTVGAGTSGNLTISSATGTKIFTGLVTINAGATWNNSGNSPVTFRGGITHSGSTFTSGSGVYTFDTNSQALSGTLSIPSVTVTGAAVVLTNNGTLTIGTALAGTGTLSNSGTLNINFSGAPGITGLTATANGNTVSYGYAGAQTVFSTNYWHLTLATSGAKTMQAGTTTVSGNLTISGSATMTGNNTLTISGALNYSSSGSTTLAAGKAIQVATWNQTAGTIVDNGNTITVTGTGANTWTMTGTFTATGTVIFNGAAPQINTSNFNNLSTSGTGNTQTAGALTVGGILSVGDGTTFTVGAFAITVTGATNIGTGTSGNLTISSSTGAKTFTGLVTIAAGGTWNNSGDSAITFRGGITNSGTFTAGSGIQTFDTSSQALTGTFSIPSVTVTGVTLTNNGTLTVTTALAGTGGLTNAGTGILNINFTGAVGITTLTATAASNTVSYGFAGAQTIKLTNYYNLTLAGSGTKTFTSGTTGIANTFNTGGLTVDTSTNSATIDYNGTVQTVAAIDYYNLTLSNSGVKTMQSGTTTIGGALTISGSATMTGNASLVITGALNYSSSGSTTLAAATPIQVGTWNQTAGTIIDNGNTITVTGTGPSTWTMTGTFTPTGTVIFTGAAPQIGTSNFNNLTISGTGGTNTGSLNIAGDFAISNGTTFTAAGFGFTVTGTTTIGTGTSGNLTISSAAGAKVFTGLVTINAGGTWNNSGNSTISFRGGITNNGTFTAGSGVQTFDTNSQALNGTFVIPSVTVTGVTLTNNDSLTVNTALSGTGELTQGGNAILNLGGTSGITTLTAITEGNTVNYTSNTAGQTIKPVVYVNLTIDKAGQVGTLGGPILVAGNLVINAGTLDVDNVNNYPIIVNGDWTNNGTFLARQGLVLFAGVANQTINDDNTWFGLAITVAATRTVYFESGKTQTVGVNGLLTFTGAAGQLLTLAPKTAGVAWILNVDGTALQTITNITASYSDASGDAEINASDPSNVDGLNNIHWLFPVAGGSSGSKLPPPPIAPPPAPPAEEVIVVVFHPVPTETPIPTPAPTPEPFPYLPTALVTFFQETGSFIADEATQVYTFVVEAIGDGVDSSRIYLAGLGQTIANDFDASRTFIVGTGQRIAEGVNQPFIQGRGFFARLQLGLQKFYEIVFIQEPNHISNVATAPSIDPITGNAAMTITWQTNHLSTSQINFGSAVGIYENTNYDQTQTRSHSITLNGLEPGRTYYYEILSQNNELAVDAFRSFTVPNQ